MADFELIVVPFIATAALSAAGVFAARLRRRVVPAGGGSVAASGMPGRLARIQLMILPVSLFILAFVGLFLGLFFAITG